MIIDLILVPGLIVFSFLVGGGFVHTYLANIRKLDFFIFTQVVGSGCIFLLSSWFSYLRIDNSKLIPTLIVLGFFSWLIPLGRNRIRIRKFLSRTTNFHYLILLLPVVITAFLRNRSWTNSKFSYRIGPDSFGWSTSSLYFCSNENINPLKARIQEFLGETSFRDSLLIPVPNGGKSILAISSFTDQVNAEFLLQANRLGIPSILGSACRFSGEHNFFHLFNALALWSTLITLLITFSILQKFNLNFFQSATISMVSVFSYSALSVQLEGGYGQHVTGIYLIFLLMLYLNADRFSKTFFVFAIAFVTSVLLVTYIDALLVLIPFCLLLGIFAFFTNVTFKHFNFRYLYIFIAIPLGLPGVVNAWNTIAERFMRPDYGGWDQGNFPFISSLAGFNLWLPTGMYEKQQLSTLDLAVGVICSLLVLISAVQIKENKVRQILFAALIFYFLLCAQTYLKSDAFPNNYRIWKFGYYVALLIPIFLGYLGRLLNLESNRRRAVIFLLPSVITLNTLTWSFDWIESSKLTLSHADAQIVRFYSGNNDIAAINIYAAMLTMYGNIRYGAAQRNYGIETEQTFGPDRLVYILPSFPKCEKYACSHFTPEQVKNRRIKILKQGDEITAIRLIKK